MKEFKRCPRCRTKVPNDFGRCGNCGLNFVKFQDATNTEAKSAFRMGEKERVLHTTHRPSDVSKFKILMLCIFGGWLGFHYFSLGKLWRGIFQAIGFGFGLIYTRCAVILAIRSGYLGFFILLLGIAWAISVAIWISDILAIIFNRFKYPVSLPYTKTETGKGE